MSTGGGGREADGPRAVGLRAVVPVGAAGAVSDVGDGPARADLEQASAEENRATAKVRFLAELRNTVTSADASAEPQIEERRVAELWTFERTLGASDPNWVLARTEPAAA